MTARFFPEPIFDLRARMGVFVCGFPLPDKGSCLEVKGKKGLFFDGGKRT